MIICYLTSTSVRLSNIVTRMKRAMLISVSLSSFPATSVILCRGELSSLNSIRHSQHTPCKQISSSQRSVVQSTEIPGHVPPIQRRISQSDPALKGRALIQTLSSLLLVVQVRHREREVRLRADHSPCIERRLCPPLTVWNLIDNACRSRCQSLLTT
ncbi:hypothetical protein EDB19DRAFT_104705 [Suillus lakei]|nr:hypothetical protein EDB19DRAFT_104705 [Suillus lakei]